MIRQPVKNYENWEKDLHSGAIVNCDMNAYTAAKKRKYLEQEKEKEFNSLKDNVKNLTLLVEKLLEKLDK